jgi:hypothetical protein
MTTGNNNIDIGNQGTALRERHDPHRHAGHKYPYVLERVSALPITQWRYKMEGDGARHLGPMAQGFHEAFGLTALTTSTSPPWTKTAWRWRPSRG